MTGKLIVIGTLGAIPDGFVGGWKSLKSEDGSRPSKFSIVKIVLNTEKNSEDQK